LFDDFLDVRRVVGARWGGEDDWHKAAKEYGQDGWPHGWSKMGVVQA